MGIPVRKADRVYTYADYCSWPDDERWELIDGAAYDMSPAPSRRHQKLTGDIFAEIHNFLEDRECAAYIAPFDVCLPEAPGARDDEIINVVQPDVSVSWSEDKLDEKGAVAAPDIALEVLSPSTSVKDQREKLTLYERSGVREYWVVDPANETLSVYSLGRGSGGGFGKPAVYGPGDRFESRVLEGFSLDLSRVFPRQKEA